MKGKVKVCQIAWKTPKHSIFCPIVTLSPARVRIQEAVCRYPSRRSFLSVPTVALWFKMQHREALTHSLRHRSLKGPANATITNIFFCIRYVWYTYYLTQTKNSADSFPPVMAWQKRVKVKTNGEINLPGGLWVNKSTLFTLLRRCGPGQADLTLYYIAVVQTMAF